MTSTKPPAAPTTAAFHVQAVIAFGISVAAMAIALWQMPGDAWGARSSRWAPCS